MQLFLSFFMVSSEVEKLFRAFAEERKRELPQFIPDGIPITLENKFDDAIYNYLYKYWKTNSGEYDPKDDEIIMTKENSFTKNEKKFEQWLFAQYGMTNKEQREYTFKGNLVPGKFLASNADDTAKKALQQDTIEDAVEGTLKKEVLDATEFKVSAQKRLKNIRNQMPNSPLKNKGNMAIADVNITGIRKEFIAHSKINNPMDKGADRGIFSMLKSEKDRIFKTYEPASSTLEGKKFDRYHDTEAKILEDIASQIKDPNISGSINLYTEFNACQSCTNIIFEFRRMFPNIQLNIFSGQ